MDGTLTFRNYQLELVKADSERLPEISEFLHKVYADELGYYPTNSELRFDDEFHRHTSYILALEENRIVGLQGIIPCTHDYPMLRRVSDPGVLGAFDQNEGVELRLLSIAKDKRGADIFFALVLGISQFLGSDPKFKFALTSAKLQNVKLYERIGFKVIAESEVFGSTSYHMSASRESLEKFAGRFAEFATRQ